MGSRPRRSARPRGLLLPILIALGAVVAIVVIVATRTGEDTATGDDELLALLFDSALGQQGVDVSLPDQAVPGGGTAGPDIDGGDGGGGDGGGGTDDASQDPVTDVPLDVAGLALQPADLPDGWRAVDAAAAIGIGGLCAGVDDVADQPFVSDQAIYEQGPGGPILASTVGDHGRTFGAERYLASIRDAIAACAETGTAEGLDLEPTSLEGVGDESVAADLTGSVGGRRVTGELLVVRVGSRTTVLVSLAQEGDDPGLARDLIGRIAARL